MNRTIPALNQITYLEFAKWYYKVNNKTNTKIQKFERLESLDDSDDEKNTEHEIVNNTNSEHSDKNEINYFYKTTKNKISGKKVSKQKAIIIEENEEVEKMLINKYILKRRQNEINLISISDEISLKNKLQKLDENIEEMKLIFDQRNILNNEEILKMNFNEFCARYKISKNKNWSYLHDNKIFKRIPILFRNGYLQYFKRRKYPTIIRTRFLTPIHGEDYWQKLLLSTVPVPPAKPHINNKILLNINSTLTYKEECKIRK